MVSQYAIIVAKKQARKYSRYVAGTSQKYTSQKSRKELGNEVGKKQPGSRQEVIHEREQRTIQESMLERYHFFGDWETPNDNP